MKLKCKKCGKKTAELMSKAEIKTANFLPPTVIDRILNMFLDMVEQKYIVCKSCGHYEEQ